MKFDVDNIWQCVSGSPSMRREWIEIFLPRVAGLVSVSPSMRREWIEMKLPSIIQMSSTSPSMRREWIEIELFASSDAAKRGLPPCGGSGLKFITIRKMLF